MLNNSESLVRARNTSRPVQTAEHEALSPISRSSERVLLINPPVYDTRLPWGQYLQPTTLLRLAHIFRCAGCDVKLVDALEHGKDELPPRAKHGEYVFDGIKVGRWRFGLSPANMAKALKVLASSGWYPELIVVDCFTTYWWQGAAETIESVRQHFPQAQVVLSGTYADLAHKHAEKHTAADSFLSTATAGISDAPTDLSVWTTRPPIDYISFGSGARQVGDIVEEIVEKRKKYSLRTFVFADHAIISRFPNQYHLALEQIIARKLDIRFYALGNIEVSELVDNPGIAKLMKYAGYRQICFADDRDAPTTSAADDQFVDMCRRAAEICQHAGFEARSDEITASVSLGRPGEDLSARASVITRIAHHAGAVIIWPYQPLPEQCPDLPLEEQNGKFFPLRVEHDATFEHYLRLLGLATILNAKYRTQTVDFLGDSLVSQLFRDSIARKAWEPDPVVKGPLQLPMRLPVIQQGIKGEVHG